MSIVSPPIAAARSVKDLLPSDELGHGVQAQVCEDPHALDDLPQGALVMLTQLQPLPEPPRKPSLAVLHSGAEAEPRSAKASVDQAMHLPMKQPSVPSSPVPVDARLALLATRFPIAAPSVPSLPAQVDSRLALLTTRFPIAAQGHAKASFANALATPAQAGVDASGQQKAPLSSPRLPTAMRPQEPDRIAVASSPWACDQAAADRLVKQDTPQALPAQPPPLLEKSLHSYHATSLPGAANPTSKPTSEPKSAPEDSTAQGGRSYLQVPFGKGSAVSLITVSKAGGERPEQLLLNPDSASVFSYLSDHMAQVPDPRWRMAHQQGHENSHERALADEDVEEESRQAPRDRSEQGGQQA